MIWLLNTIRLHKVGSAMAVLAFSCIASWGQAEAKFAAAQLENSKELRQYSWKTRTEVWKDGESKSVQVSVIQFAADGTLHPTQISSTQAAVPSGGIKGLIAKKKKEELVLITNGLSILAKSYASLPSGKLERFMRTATVKHEVTTAQQLVAIHGVDVLEPGDSMTIWVDAMTRRQIRVQIQTSFDNKPVKIVSEFKDLPNGPNYAARTVIEYSAEDLTITTENTDHRRER